MRLEIVFFSWMTPNYYTKMMGYFIKHPQTKMVVEGTSNVPSLPKSSKYCGGINPDPRRRLFLVGAWGSKDRSSQGVWKTRDKKFHCSKSSTIEACDLLFQRSARCTLQPTGTIGNSLGESMAIWWFKPWPFDPRTLEVTDPKKVEQKCEACLFL